MKTTLFLIAGILVTITIYQSIQIKKLKKQTIDAFKKLCEKIFDGGH